MIVYVSITEILKLYQFVPKIHLFSFEFIRLKILSQMEYYQIPSKYLSNK